MTAAARIARTTQTHVGVLLAVGLDGVVDGGGTTTLRVVVWRTVVATVSAGAVSETVVVSVAVVPLFAA
jgi:hypothetical protein